MKDQEGQLQAVAVTRTEPHEDGLELGQRKSGYFFLAFFAVFLTGFFLAAATLSHLLSEVEGWTTIGAREMIMLAIQTFGCSIRV